MTIQLINIENSEFYYLLKSNDDNQLGTIEKFDGNWILFPDNNVSFSRPELERIISFMNVRIS